MNTKTTLLAVLISLLAGCARVDTGLLDFVTTRDLTQQNPDQPLTSKGRYTGIDTTRIFFVVPTGHPNIEQAIEDAVQGRGKALKDAQVTYRFWYIPFIYGEESIEVDGEVLA